MRLLPLLYLLLSSSILAAEMPDWKPEADLICKQIHTAVDFYKKGDLKNARLTAIMSYFKGYDTQIEPAIRITLGGKHVFEVERQFRNFSAKMTPNPDKKQQKIVAETASDLCQAVYKDAEALNAEKVQRQVFKVDK